MLGARYGYFKVSDPHQIYLIEWVIETVNDCWSRFSSFDWYTTEHSQKDLVDTAATWGKFTKLLDSHLELNAGSYLVGNSITIADFMAAALFHSCCFNEHLRNEELMV